MKTICALSILLCMAAFAQDSKPGPIFPKIARIEGPCLQIVGRLCYNSYQVKGDGGGKETDGWWKTGKTHFGFYSFDDKTRKVTIIESVDCKHPNDRIAWGNAGPDPKAIFPIYRSRKIDGLYESCYGVVD